MKMHIEERLREIRSIADCEDAHVAISDLADCMLDICKRLKKLENRGPAGTTETRTICGHTELLG